MLYVLTRDGKAYHDFMDEHNLTKDNTQLIRSITQIYNIPEGKYVLINPLPSGFNNQLRQYLQKWNNVTSYYNKKCYSNH